MTTTTMMERAMDWVRGCAQLAWWDGSCLDLRLHRFTDFLDFVATAPEPGAALIRRGPSA